MPVKITRWKNGKETIEVSPDFYITEVDDTYELRPEHRDEVHKAINEFKGNEKHAIFPYAVKGLKVRPIYPPREAWR